MTDTSPTRFQTFDATTTPDQGPPRLAALRAEMAARGVDGFLVPRSDAHQGEYVAARDERLAWLTGFTGSAGFAVALKDSAAVFTDGRYSLQVRAQTDPAFAPVNWPKTRLEAWLPEAMPGGGVVAYLYDIPLQRNWYEQIGHNSLHPSKMYRLILMPL